MPAFAETGRSADAVALRVHDDRLMTETLTTPAPPRKKANRDWMIPAGLIVLVLVPIIAGVMRLAWFATGAEQTPENTRFATLPAPVIIHIISATFYTVVGAFQFHPGLRRRRPRWHRISGRILVPMGIAAALSGLWMNAVYALPADSYGPLWIARWVFGLGMAAAIVLAFRAVLRRDFKTHRAWMIRAYAIAVGAGTQVITSLIWFIIVGEGAENTTSVPLIGGWVVNLLIAEWIIRRRPTRKIQR